MSHENMTAVGRMHIVMAGDPIAGYTLYGPFSSEARAIKWAQCNSKTELTDVPWEVMEVESPLSCDEAVFFEWVAGTEVLGPAWARDDDPFAPGQPPPKLGPTEGQIAEWDREKSQEERERWLWNAPDDQRYPPDCPSDFYGVGR